MLDISEQKGTYTWSIPGIGEVTIAAILGELALFENCDRVQKVVAYIGLAPKEFMSGALLRASRGSVKWGNARMREGPHYAIPCCHAA